MGSDWIDEQRKAIEKKQDELSEFRSQVTKERPQVLPEDKDDDSKASVRQTRKNIKPYIYVFLVVANFSNLLRGAEQLYRSPERVTLSFESDLVKVGLDEQENKHYFVDVPLREFPYEIQLNQHNRTDLVFLASVNLILLGTLYYFHRRD
ncbi:MAG: hypothetical protein RID07_16665, partial [Lacipirellulaceae bacterium]